MSETGETTYGLPIDWRGRATAAEERVKRLREALEWYASDEPYGVTCATECGVPTEMPHLVIEEDRGARARTALSREGEKA